MAATGVQVAAGEEAVVVVAGVPDWRGGERSSTAAAVRSDRDGAARTCRDLCRVIAGQYIIVG